MFNLTSEIVYGYTAEACFYAGYTYGILSILALIASGWILYRLITKWRTNA